MKREGSGLRLNWRKTWEDRENDFSAAAGDIRVGRIYFSIGGATTITRWDWFLHCQIGNTWLSDRGRAETAHQAALEIERIWFERGEPAMKDGR